MSSIPFVFCRNQQVFLVHSVIMSRTRIWQIVDFSHKSQKCRSWRQQMCILQSLFAFMNTVLMWTKYIYPGVCINSVLKMQKNSSWRTQMFIIQLFDSFMNCSYGINCLISITMNILNLLIEVFLIMWSIYVKKKHIQLFWSMLTIAMFVKCLNEAPWSQKINSWRYQTFMN